MNKWTFHSQLEVNKIMRQVWIRPSTDHEGETDFAITFDLGEGENPPTNGHGYWTNQKAFQDKFPKFVF